MQQGSACIASCWSATFRVYVSGEWLKTCWVNKCSHTEVNSGVYSPVRYTLQLVHLGDREFQELAA